MNFKNPISKFKIKNIEYSVAIVLIIILMLVVNDVLRLYIVRQNAIDTETELNDLDNRISKRRIEKEKQLVEIAVRDFSKLAEQYIRDNLPDSLFSVARLTLESNEHISCSGIAFRPDYFENMKGSFIPSAYRDGDTIRIDVYNAQLFNYYQREWYQSSLEAKKAIWTDSYMDDTHGIQVFTYAFPLWGGSDSIIAVYYADMPVAWLDEASVVKTTLRAQSEKLQRRMWVMTLLLICIDILLLGFIFWIARKMVNHLRDSEESKARLTGELRVAGNIQRGLLPASFPQRKDIVCHALLTPAKQVGGDLYDYQLRDEKFFFCIGDVSGKGVPASLLMAVMSSAFRTLTDRDSKPDQIVAAMNKTVIASNSQNMFVTLFLGVLDLPTGRLRFCNAGHGSPIMLVGAAEDSTWRVEHLEVESNLPVGAMENFPFQAQETVLPDGATLFLYSDGLNEAMDCNHALFSENRVLDVLRRLTQANDMAPERLITAMQSEVALFVGDTEQSDDLTMLALQYHKPVSAFKSMRSLTLPCDVQRIPELNSFVQSVGQEVGMSESPLKELQLAAEELVVNAMSYAYPIGHKGDVLIEVSWNAEMLQLRLSDSGKPFDPTALPEADITLSVEERNIGGLGVHLVRQLTDSINYERVNERNVLTISKSIK
ncbi:MAG: SpoIIE family protein phosphatase [Bacteroidales bacterium]|nr:SpoIIE family protein phosphatase [Bacteroidales bacterium]MBO7648019.1 SpoIIE family protein phosphatase [Bacteroidales bacterium]